MAKVEKFRFWCQKVLPLVYDDSLSYYELLCKVVAYLNNTISGVNENTEDIANLLLELGELRDFVDNYFNNLDVQEEINNKLDKMVEDGTLTNLFFPILPFIMPQMYGAKGDGVNDDTRAFEKMFENCLNGSHCYIPKGSYLISNTLNVPSDIKISCDGILVKNGNYNVMLNLGNSIDMQINIDGNNSETEQIVSETDNTIYGDGVNNVTIHDSKLINIGGNSGMLFKNSSNISICNTLIDTYVYIGIGISINCNKCKVLHNTVLNGHGNTVNRYPISLGIGVDTNEQRTHDIICDSNYIEDIEPRWEAIDSHGSYNVVVTNNIIKNTLTGIAFVSTNADIKNENITISNNSFYLDVDNSNVGNSFGIVVEAPTGSNNINVINNVIEHKETNSVSIGVGGIYLIGDNILCSNNNIIGNNIGNGILLTSSTNSVSRIVKIVNNIIRNFVQGFQAMNTALTHIEAEFYNNTIVNCTNAIQGNKNYGTKGAYYNSVYCHDNKVVDCANYYVNNLHGTYISPQTAFPANGCGKLYQIVLNTATTSGSPIGWICTAEATENTGAVWKVIGNYS